MLNSVRFIVLIGVLISASYCQAQKAPGCEEASALVQKALLVGDGSDEEAELYEKAIDQCPTFAEALHNLGVIASESGDYGKAKRLFAKAVSLKQDANFLLSLAFVHFKEGELDEAIELYHKASKKDPTSATAYLALARINELRRNYTKAIELLDHIAKIDSTNVSAAKFRATILEKQGLTDEAIKYLSSYLDTTPNLEIYVDLSLLYIKKGRLEAAIKYLLKASKIDPTNHEVNLVLATAYSNKEDFLSAKKYLQRILDQEPDHSVALANLALVHAQLKDFDQALKVGNKANKIEESYEADMALGYSYSYLMNYKEAKNYFQKALKILPKDLDEQGRQKAGLAHYNLSITLSQLGAARESEREAKLAKALGVE